MTKSRLKLIIIFLLHTSSCYTLDKETVLNNIANLFQNKVDIFQSDIEQTIFVYDMENPQKMKGNIILKKPDKVYLDYSEPSKQLVVSNGEKIWLYFPGTKQVIIQDTTDVKTQDNFFFNLSSFIENLKNRFDYKILTESERLEDIDTVLMEFAPKEENKDNMEFNTIKMWINKGKWVAVKISVYYNETNNVSISFKNIKINPKIEPDIFNFLVSTDMEIISLPLR